MSTQGQSRMEVIRLYIDGHIKQKVAAKRWLLASQGQEESTESSHAWSNGYTV